MEIEDRTFVVVVESLDRLTAHPAVSLGYALEECREVESLDLKAIVETEGIAREIVAHYETVFIIDDLVAVLVDILDVTGLWSDAHKVWRVGSLFVRLEETVVSG